VWEKQPRQEEEQRNVERIEGVPRQPEGECIDLDTGAAHTVDDVSEHNENDAYAFGYVHPL